MKYLILIIMLLIQCKSKEEKAYEEFAKKMETQHKEQAAYEEQIAKKEQAERDSIEHYRNYSTKYANKWLVITATEKDSLSAVKKNHEVLNTSYFKGLKNGFFVSVAKACASNNIADEYAKNNLKGDDYYIKFSGEFLVKGIEVDYKKTDFKKFKEMADKFANKWVGITNDSNSTSTFISGDNFSDLNNNKKYYSITKFGFSDTIKLKEYTKNYEFDIDTMLFTGYLKNVLNVPKDFEDNNLKYWYQINNNLAIYYKSIVDTLENYKDDFYFYLSNQKKEIPIIKYLNEYIDYEMTLLSNENLLFVFNKKGLDILRNTNQFVFLLSSTGNIIKEDTIGYAYDDEGNFMGENLSVKKSLIQLINHTFDSIDTTIWYDGIY